MTTRSRVILHVDMDAFYAAVEVRDDPSLAGKPLIIGHRGPRGVVSTCSYEARRYGVRSAMPSLTAMRLCPDALWRPGRMDVYAAVSRRIRRLFDEFTPIVEPVSIDEAFLDLTGVVADLQAGRESGRRLKERIRSEERLTASVGVAPAKFLAKVASDLEKPDGLVVLPPEEVPARLWPLPLERLWGVGPKTAPRLRALGLATIGDVLRAGEDRLRAVVGEGAAAHLLALARGDDPRVVTPDRETRSISEERTYARDLGSPEEIERALLARSEGVARSLRREGLRARTIGIKVRTGDYRTVTRVATLSRPTALAETVYAAARRLLRERVNLGRQGVRLLGVSATGLLPAGAGQIDLFPDLADERAARAARATDRLVARYGEGAITRARLLRRGPSRSAPAPSRPPRG